MKTARLSGLFLALVLASSCATLQVGSDVHSGRQAFLTGNNEAALSYFHRAAKTNPHYVYGTALQQSIWSFVGRSEYATGRLPQARQSLERALARSDREDVARLYLGLTLAKAGERDRGLREIETGMRGINEWLEYVNDAHRFSFGQYWDPRREIRSSIQTDLAMLSGKNVDLERLVADAEWLGRRLEEEADRARDQESKDFSRDNDGNGDHP